MQHKFGGQNFVDPKSFRQVSTQRLISPEVAEKRRNERKVPENVYRPQAVVGQTAPIEAPPSIALLAIALQNDVDLIFQFIHDNIQVYFNYGLAKGGYGALCDGNGNPFDQSDLMVQLLTAAGYTASYVTGYISLDADMWSNWLNVSTSDIVLAANLLGNGGFSGTYNTETNELAIDYCWVQVSIGGTDYQFDPAMKVNNSIAGIDLASAMEYSQSTFLSDAEIGATITDNYAQNINETNINANLSDYAMNLVSWIQANNSGASFDQILGGRTIVPVSGPVRNTTLPYQDTDYPSYVYGAGELPGTYCATVQIQYDLVDGVYKINQTFYSADIYGQRMSLWYNTDIEAQLYLNGTVLATSAVQTSGSMSPLIFTITHPYASDFADETTSIDVEAGIYYGIGNGWGYASRQLAEIHRQALIANISGTATAEDVLGESLAIAWFNFIGENSSGVDIINRLSSTFTTYHHQIGIIGQGSTTLLVNFFDNIWSTLPLTDSALPDPASAHVSLLWHQLEAAVVTQTSGFPCASAPSFIATANLDGTAIYTATASNWFSVVKPALTTAGYTAAVLSEIQEYMAVEEATISGDVSVDGGDVLNIFVYNSGLSTNPTEVSYTTVPGDTIYAIAEELASAINANSALATIGVTATSSVDDNVITITSTSTNATTYSQSVTVGDEIIDLGNWTVTIPDNPSVDVGGYFTGYAYYLLSPYGTEFLGPLSGTIKGAGGPGTPGDNNDGCSDNTPGVGTQGQSGSPPATSGEPIDLYQGRYLYSNVDMSVGNQSDPYKLTLVRSYNSGNLIKNQTLGYGWNHNFQISAATNSDGFIAFGYQSVSAAAAVIAEMYVCQDLLQSTTPSVPIANAVTICVMNFWMMNQIANNTAIIQFGSAYQVFAKLPDGSYVAPLGVKTSTTLTNTGTFAYTTPDKVVYTFNSSGQVAAITYPFGIIIDFTYTSGKLTKVTNGFRTLTLAYSGANLSTVTDGNGRTVHYTITSSELTKFEDALSQSTTYDYGSGTAGLLTEIYSPANPSDPIVTNVYDALNRVQTQSDAYGNIWSYYFAGSRSEEVDPNNNSHILYFDAQGNVIQDIDALGNTVILTRDGLERLASVTMPEGNGANYDYDSNCNILSVTAFPKPGSGLANVVNSFMYDMAWNKVNVITDNQGNITNLTYDPTSGKLTQIKYPPVDAGIACINNSYNSVGQLIQSVDPTGLTIAYGYDPTTHSLLSIVVDSTVDGFNITTAFTWDAVGNLLTFTDGNLNTTTFAFDANRRLSSVTAPSPFGYLNSFAYDLNDNLIQISQQTNTTNQIYSATYSIDNLVTSITEPSINTWGQQPNPTFLAYDNLRRLSSQIDPLGNQYAYSFDPLNRVSQVQYPNGVIGDARIYTANGLLQSLTDSLSQATSFGFDGFDRLVTTTFPDTTTELNSYDLSDNVSSFVTRAGVTIAFGHDALNQLTSKTVGTAPTVDYSYDLSGRPTAAATPLVAGDPSTGSFQFFFDTAGRLYKEQYPDEKLVVFVLDQNSNITNITYPDGSSVAQSYDQLNRLTTVNGVYGNASFGYDPLSRRVLQAYGNGINTGFNYDQGNNLVALTFGSQPPLLLQYAYNGAHQEIDQRASDGTFLWEPSSDETVPYGSVNSVNQYPNVNGASCSYNGNGCLTSDGTFAYGYDDENNLTSAISDTVSVAFKYDPLGRQVQKTVGSTSTRFLYSGFQRIADYDASGDLINRYIYTNNLDEPIWVETSTELVCYMHSDRSGSVIMTTDASGNLINTSAYSPFGSSSSVDATTNIGFTGQRFDPETGLYYFKARYYSPIIGRFLQNDPIGLDGGDFNLYAYVKNDPKNSADPMGLTPSSGLTLRGGVQFFEQDPSPAYETSPLDSILVQLPDIPQPVVDFVAGSGDNLSFGLTWLVRQAMNTNQYVNTNSIGYGGGQVTGIVLSGIVTSGANIAGGAVKTAATTPVGKYLVYTYTDSNNVVRYVGITSAFIARHAAHLRLRGFSIVPIKNLSATLQKIEARGVEQALIEYHGIMTGSKAVPGGTLFNLINSISPTKNPALYQNAKALGTQLLKQAGYSGF